MKRYLCVFCVLCATALAVSGQMLDERFRTAPNWSGNWLKVRDEGLTNLNYNPKNLRLRAEATKKESAITLRSKLAVKSPELTVKFRHGGFGRTMICLGSDRFGVNPADGNAVACLVLDTDDADHLGVNAFGQPVNMSRKGRPYMNRKVIFRIRIVGGKAEFLVRQGPRWKVLERKQVPVGAISESYHAVLSVGCIEWKSGGNDTRFYHVTLRGQ